LIDSQHVAGKMFRGSTIPFHRISPLTVAAALLVLPWSPSLALTADEVWAEWQRIAKHGDRGITAIARRDGDRLVLTNIVLPIGPPDDRADMTVGRIELENRPDGTVAVMLPETFPITIDDRGGSRTGPDVVTLAASAPGFAMIISGIGETAAFEISAPSLVLSVDKITPALQAGQQLDLNLALADLSVTHRMDLTQATETVASLLRVGTLHADFLFDLDDPDQEKVELSFDVSGLGVTLDAVVPPSAQGRASAGPDANENSFPEILKAVADGLSIKADLSHDTIAMQGEVVETDGELMVDFTSAKGTATLGIDATKGAYEVLLGQTAMSVKGNVPDLEYPNTSLSFAELAYGMSLGIGDLTQPQEGRFTARLIDLAIPPELWLQIDPTGALGASPLSFALDIAGKFALAPEMLEPGWQPAPGVFPPLDIVDLTLGEFAVKAAGVDLNGGGTLTFDESDLVTFEGVPAPDGKLSFRATGVNSLIDRLAGAGLLPPDEVTAFRMGLMFIAKADEGPDNLKTEIEFRENGFYLNGVKMR
jgi:hypothetical protein